MYNNGNTFILHVFIIYLGYLRHKYNKLRIKYRDICKINYKINYNGMKILENNKMKILYKNRMKILNKEDAYHYTHMHMFKPTRT